MPKLPRFSPTINDEDRGADKASHVAKTFGASCRWRAASFDCPSSHSYCVQSRSSASRRGVGYRQLTPDPAIAACRKSDRAGRATHGGLQRVRRVIVDSHAPAGKGRVTMFGSSRKSTLSHRRVSEAGALWRYRYDSHNVYYGTCA